MKISDSFKNAIRQTFYDKTINLYNIVTTLDELGGETISFNLIKKAINANVQEVTQDIVSKEYGSDVVGSYKITCDNIDAIKMPDAVNPTQAISYNDIYFFITGVKKFDSHAELIVLMESKVRK